MALVSFTQSLNAAESWAAREPNNREARTAVACANHLMGQVLAGNGEPDAARAKLRKAFEIFRDLAGSSDVKPADQTPAALEDAIQQVGRAAPVQLGKEIRASVVGRTD